jgi:phosphoribosylamine---glycine ligase
VNVLVLGGGGREHALVWALDRSPSVGRVVCAPGNAGIGAVADLRAIDPADPDAVVDLAGDVGADLVVVGPEAPLIAGVADALAAAGTPVFGPTAEAARLEGSKTFAKQVMEAAGVPTAGYWSGTDPAAGVAALDRFEPPYVVKADGLAAGKGVRICLTRSEAVSAIDEALVQDAFGEAGRRVVVEEFLSGPEVSVFAVADGRTTRQLATARDYKRALDGDRGLNTGGMGAVSPAPGLPTELVEQTQELVLDPVTREMARRGSPYVGVLYAGLVLTDDGPKVLEFNARFGDPETQVVLPRMRSDLGELLLAAATGRLGDVPVPAFDEAACVTVVLASGGYPGAYETGRRIEGLDDAAAVPGTLVFHAGTRRQDDGVVTSGGRVLAVSGQGATVDEARAAAYRAADRIRFAGLHRREDIAS